MSRQRLPSMYEEDFDDNDNTEGNDDDMAALGSILSWDENEDNDNAAKNEEEVTGSVNNTSAPFETLEFSSRNSVSNHSFLQNSNYGALPLQDAKTSVTTGMQFQVPTPVSIPCFSTQQIQQGRSSQKAVSTILSTAGESSSDDQNNQQQQQQQNISQQQQLEMPLNLSPEQQQFIAQNPQAFAEFLTSTVFQTGYQQNQLQSSNLSQNHSTQPQQVPIVTTVSNQPLSQATPQSQVHGVKQQQSVALEQQTQLQPQSTYSSDTNALLQHFQMVQVQQQLQAFQTQQQLQVSQTQQQQSNAQPNLHIQSALQHLQVQFAQAQGNVAQSNPSRTSAAMFNPANVQSVTSQQDIGTVKSEPSSEGNPPLSSSSLKIGKGLNAKKIVPMTSSFPKTKMSSKRGESHAAGLVSASDTEGEASRRAKSLLFDEDPNDDNDNDMDFSHLPPAEKIKANRDRNREHARNTRLRKKEYLEKLKHTVDELCRERDTLVSERASAANLLVEMHNIRSEVLMSLLALRTSNERRRTLWSSILDESCFTCVMPVTPYRSFPTSEVQVSKCQRTILGIDGMIADTASLHVLFDCLVDRSMFPFEKIDFRYTLVTEEAVVAGNQIMARWVMTTTNAVQYGAKMEVSKQGMLCCKFNSAHKITWLEFMFDVMAFMLQLKQACGSEGFTVVPNTLQTCQRSFESPMVMTHADPPYTIVTVNKLWEEMTGYSSEEVVGRGSCAILQRADMDRTSLKRMMDEVRYNRPASALLVNRRKSGEDFTNFLVVYPLSVDSRITYFIGLTLSNKLGKPCRSIGSIPSCDESAPIQKPAQESFATMRASSVNFTGLVQKMQSQSIQNQAMLSNAALTSSGVGQLGSVSQLIPSIQGPPKFIASIASNTLKRAREDDANNSRN